MSFTALFGNLIIRQRSHYHHHHHHHHDVAATAVQDVLGILVELNAMEADTLRLLPLGRVARSINCNNELWMSAALSHPCVMDLTPPQLAAFVGALQCTDLLKRPMSIWSSYQVGGVSGCSIQGSGIHQFL